MIRRTIEKCGRERGQDPVAKQSGLLLHAQRARSVYAVNTDRAATRTWFNESRTPRSAPLAFQKYLPAKAVFNCNRIFLPTKAVFHWNPLFRFLSPWLFRFILPYPQDSPLKPVSLPTTHIHIDIYRYIYISALYPNNGLRKRACAPNLPPLFGRCFAANIRWNLEPMRVYRSPTRWCLINTRRSRDPSDPADIVCQVHPPSRRVMTFQMISSSFV